MPIIVAEIIAFIKPKMMSHELPYIYTILGHFLTRIVCYLVNILKRSSKDMYLLCNLNFLHIDFPNPCRAQLLLLLLSSHQPFYQLVHLFAQHSNSYWKFMWTNNNHTDGIFRIISREATYECKFVRTSFIVITL